MTNLLSRKYWGMLFVSFPSSLIIYWHLATHLPLETTSCCTLQPTPMAIETGFYGLKNIKLALDQSLIRIRGCLNVKDVVPYWFRGNDLIWWFRIEVVSFVDTDVEVIIATVDVDEQDHETSKALVFLQVLDTYCRTIPLMSTDVDGTVQRQYLKLPTEPIRTILQCHNNSNKRRERKSFIERNSKALGEDVGRMRLGHIQREH